MSPRRRPALVESLEPRTLLANALLEFSISGPTSITEGNTPGQYTAAYTISLNAPSPLFASVQVVAHDGTALAGRDYTAPTSDPVIFAVGQTQATVLVPILGNTAVNANRNFTISLTNPISASISQAHPQVTTTIVDDDQPVVTIQATDASASEAGDTGNFRISRTGPITKALSVIVAVVGTATNSADFQLIPTKIIIPAGHAYVDVPLKPVADSLVEGAETVLLKLHGSKSYKVGSAKSATITITDRETTPPTAKLISAPNLTQATTDDYQFTVRYTDNVQLNAATIGNKDLRVTGPNGYSALAHLVSRTITKAGRIITATYSVPAPGGQWDAADNGTYTLSIVARQVQDAARNPITPGALAQFTVNIPAPAAPAFSTTRIRPDAILPDSPL